MSSNDSIIGHDFLFIREGNRHYRVFFSQIRYMEARKSYSRIVTSDKAWMVTMGISQLEEVLPANDFCRIHRSYIVRLGNIEWFEVTKLRVGNKDLPIGDAYRSQLRLKVLLVPGETPAARILAAAKALVHA